MKYTDIEIEIARLLFDYTEDVILSEDIAEDIMILLSEKLR
jgi:hypothetical protein